MPGVPFGRANYWRHFPGNEQRRQLAEENRLDFAGIIESASQPPSAEPSTKAGIIHHGELARTDRDDSSHGDQVPRLMKRMQENRPKTI